MSKKISNLSFDNFNIADEFSERLPRFRKNLVANFPLDGTLENSVPDAEIYVENNTIKTRGIISNIIKTNSNVTAVDNKMNFTGNVNSFLDLNTAILNGVNDFCIEVKFTITTTTSINCILHAARNVSGLENEFSLIHRIESNSLYTDMYNVTDESDPGKSYSISNTGEINPNQSYVLKIIRKKGILTSFINDTFKKQYRAYGELKVDRLVLGQEVDMPVLSNTFDANQAFAGQIEYIKFYRYDNLLTSNNQEVNNFGLLGPGCPSVNVANDVVGIYNNLTLPFTLIESDTVLMNHKIRKVKMSITTETALNSIRIGNGNCGVCSSPILFKDNVKYCAYQFFKPISHNDLVLSGSISNISGWYAGKVIKLNDGWYMYYQYRNGTATSLKSDSVFMSFRSDTLKLGEDVVMEVSPLIVLEGTEVPGSYNIGPLSTKVNTGSIIDVNKFINPLLGDFSIGFNWKPVAHTTHTDTPSLCWFGSWTTNNSQDWLGIYRGKGWNIDALTIGTISKSTGSTYQIGSASGISNRLSHDIYVGVSYNRTTKKVIGIVYDKTTREYLSVSETVNTNLNLVNFSTGFLNDKNGDIITNFSIYNKALSIAEFENNYMSKFTIHEKGDIYVNRLSETIPNIPKENIYYVPMGNSTKSACGRLDKIPTCPDPFYTEGGVFSGTANAELVIDLTKSQSIGAVKAASPGWNNKLHDDAYLLPGWSNGYNSVTASPTIGYHAKWVKEGPVGQIVGKFIDNNTQFGLGHRWLGVARTIEATEFGLWNTCVTGSKITVAFKARADKKDSTMKIGFYRNQKSNSSMDFGSQLKTVTLEESWKEYYIDFIIDADWDLSKLAGLYVYGHWGQLFDTTTYITDIVLIKNGSKMTSEIANHLKQNQLISYNLNGSIGLDWTKPWQICYWKKAIGPTINNYHLDALGNGTIANKGYIYWGHSSGINTLVSSISQKNTAIDDNNYYNKWIFVSIKFDGTLCTVEHYGERINSKVIDPMTVPASDFFYTASTGSDLSLAGYLYNSGIRSNASVIKDLIIIKDGCMTDEETKLLSKTKMSYKEDRLIANCELKETLI